jgi:hypothetical protein
MRTLVSFLFFLIAAALANAAVPPIDVAVSDESGKVVFKGVTNARGVFVTEKVKSGTYLVQLTSKNPAIRGHQYGLELSSGSSNLSVHSIEGEKFSGEGIIMKLPVGIPIDELIKHNPGLNNPAAIKAMEKENRETKPITVKLTQEQ